MSIKTLAVNAVTYLKANKIFTHTQRQLNKIVTELQVAVVNVFSRATKNAEK